MIKDNGLANKLNLHKNGQAYAEAQADSAQPALAINATDNTVYNQPNNLKESLWPNVTNLAIALSKYFIYGYSINIVAKTNWSVFAMFAIGFSLDTILNKFVNLFGKNS
jgi:hypothetical protein